MAGMSIDGLDDLIRGIGEISMIPDEVLDQMVQAGGDVLKKAESENARTMLNEKGYSKGAVAASVKTGKTKRTADGAGCYITFNGTQHGTRIAEIAFINEYGKTGQAPRQFIRMAIEKSRDQAVQKAAEVYDRFLKSKNF